MNTYEQTLHPEVPAIRAPKWWVVLDLALGLFCLNLIVRWEEWQARRAENGKPLLDQIDALQYGRR